MRLFTIPRSAVLTTLAALFSVGCDNFTMVIEGAKSPEADDTGVISDTGVPMEEEAEEVPEGDDSETEEPEEDTDDPAEDTDIEEPVEEPVDTAAEEPEEESPDSDRDGLTDAEENELGTEKYDSDTDGDGYSDGEEVEAGSNPLNRDDIPASDDTGSETETDTGAPEADDTEEPAEGDEDTDAEADSGTVTDTGAASDSGAITEDTGVAADTATEEDTDTDTAEDTAAETDTATETEEPPCFDCVVITVTPSATRSSASVGYEVDEACEDFGDWWDTTSATASVSDDGADWSFTVEEVYDDYVGRYSLEYSSTRYSCMGSSLDGDHSAVYYDASGSSCDLEIIEISTGSGCEAQFVASCSTEPVCSL